jgi:hypothetical protein
MKGMKSFGDTRKEETCNKMKYIHEREMLSHRIFNSVPSTRVNTNQRIGNNKRKNKKSIGVLILRLHYIVNTRARLEKE